MWGRAAAEALLLTPAMDSKPLMPATMPTHLPTCSNVRLRQLVQWVFAGAPGHPALRELCDRIAEAVRAGSTFSSDARLDNLERTGAGLFTDVLLRHAGTHPPAAHQDPWGVRLLPRVLFAAPQQPAYGLSASDPGVAVLHHPSGSAWEHADSRCV